MKRAPNYAEFCIYIMQHIGKFEEISALVKRTHISFKDPKRDFEVNAHSAAQNHAEVERQRWIEKSKNLLNEVKQISILIIIDQ